MRGLIVFSLLVICSGCKKYEEGPDFTLISPEDRICRTWDLISIDGEQLLEGEKVSLTIGKNDEASYFFFYDDGSSVSETTIPVIWRLKDNKNVLSLTINLDEYSYEIIKLTQKELILFTQFDQKWVFERQE